MFCHVSDRSGSMWRMPWRVHSRLIHGNLASAVAQSTAEVKRQRLAQVPISKRPPVLLRVVDTARRPDPRCVRNVGKRVYRTWRPKDQQMAPIGRLVALICRFAALPAAHTMTRHCRLLSLRTELDVVWCAAHASLKLPLDCRLRSKAPKRRYPGRVKNICGGDRVDQQQKRRRHALRLPAFVVSSVRTTRHFCKPMRSPKSS